MLVDALTANGEANSKCAILPISELSPTILSSIDHSCLLYPQILVTNKPWQEHQTIIDKLVNNSGVFLQREDRKINVY